MRRDPLHDVRPLIHRVHAYVAYRIGPGPDAEDVTSEVFERALRYRDSFDSSRGEPAAWLIGIARRCLDDRRRAARAEAALPEEIFEGSSEHEGDVVRRLELRAALEVLDERSRDLLALRYGADLTSRDIAALLDLRTNTVEVAIHRALARLRDLVEAPQPKTLDQAATQSYPKG
jgi:RNA polymerase sigma factor (sigma-70 family)